MTTVRVHLINRNGCVTLPEKATAGSAGYDLRADLAADLVLERGQSALVPSGIAIALEDGFEAQVRPRSGLALKHGVTVLNTPGTVDADYRGEVGVILINHGAKPFTVVPGERIAQLVIAPVCHSEMVQVSELDATARGAGGFGSTGQ